MYEKFFGLSEKPFSIQPDPSFLYWGRTHRLAYAMLEYGVLNHAGISVITGEVGCGKTTLIHRLLDQLSDTHTVALLSNIQQGRGDLLSWVLMGFGEAFAEKSHVELFSQLQNFFISEYAKGRRVVLVIDEAQNLSTDMLEELRMLSNINAGKDQLLQLILVGQPQLKGLLNQPELLQLAQRIGADFHLTPLNKEEVHAYIETRLSIAGCKRRIFTERAMDYLSEQSKGVPRVINIIADTALVYAFSAEELVVGVETVRNVVRDKTEFGVFGVASDDKAAQPLRSTSASSIDSFTSGEKDDLPRMAPAEKMSRKPSAPASDNSAPRHREPSARQAQAPAPQRAAEQPQSAREAPALTKARSRQGAQGKPAQPPKEESSVTGVVIVGSRKGSAAEAAIRSAGDGRAIVFVAGHGDSDARAIARKAGAVVAETADSGPMSMGRLRNAGYRQLKKIAPHIDFVQFIDSDKALAPDWISTAEKFMRRRPEVAMVDGAVAASEPRSRKDRRSSADKETELDYLLDGAALIRASAFEEIGGFRGDIITAEMADLSIRLRRKGGRVWRLGSTMALERLRQHSLGSWAAHHNRLGFQNAYCSSLHGGPPERLGVFDTMNAVFWGGLFPLAIAVLAIGAAIAAPILFPATNTILPVLTIITGALAIYALLVLVGSLTRNASGERGFGAGAARVLSRFPQFFGVCRFLFKKK